MVSQRLRQKISRGWFFGVFLFLFHFPIPVDASEKLLRFRLTADPATLDWTLAKTSLETYLVMNLMEGMAEHGPDGKPRPLLADRWDVSPDGKTYVFHLRKGVKWSDGRALSAADFVESWIRLLNPRTGSGYASFLYDIVNAEAFHQKKITQRSKVGIRALGPDRLEVRLRRRVNHFPHLMTFWVTFPVRADLIRKHGTVWATPGKLVTLGPYLLENWEKGKLIRLKKNPTYFAADGAIAKAPEVVEALIEEDDGKARELFSSNKIDFLLNATTQDLLKSGAAEGSPTGPKFARYPYFATYYLAFNVKGGPLKDPNVRRAIALAVNRQAIPSVLKSGEMIAGSWLPPGIEGHSSESSLVGTLYDARAAMGRAGYVEGQGFPRLAFWVEQFDGSEQIARHMAERLKETLGIDVNIQFGTPEGKQADAALILTHWGADYPDPWNFFSVFASWSGNNRTGWSHPEYDAFLEKARSTADVGVQNLAYSSAEKFLVEKEVAILPLFYRKNTVLLGTRIKEFRISPLNYLFFKEVVLEK